MSPSFATRRRGTLVVAAAGIAVAAAAILLGTAPTVRSATLTAPKPAPNMAKLGRAAAAAEGPKVSLRHATIGYVRYAGASEGDARLYNSAAAAAKQIGWNVKVCDAQGVPAKFDQCGLSLLAQGVNFIFTDGIPPEAMAGTVAKAKAMGIPIISHGGTLSPEEKKQYTASYEVDDSTYGRLISKYLATKLHSGDQVAMWGFNGYWGLLRQNPFDKMAKNQGWDVVDRAQADTSNLVQGSKDAFTSKLTQFPHLKAIWSTWDQGAEGIAQAVEAKYPGMSFPQRPLIVTFLGNPSTLELIRLGEIDATTDEAMEWSGWVAVDQAAEFRARKISPSRSPRPKYEGIQFSQPVLVTKQNVPPKGQLVAPKYNFKAFFTAKWKAEFK